jgi:hypothetical protein
VWKNRNFSEKKQKGRRSNYEINKKIINNQLLIIHYQLAIITIALDEANPSIEP